MINKEERNVWSTYVKKMLKIKEVKQTIPTYLCEKEDLNPMFDVHGRCLNPFPYTQQNFIFPEKTDKEYTVVSMENSYLYIEVLPELGGRVQRVYDKQREREIFFYNQEINPHLVGTRGAWFAGGIEYNTPISHAPTSFDRIHYYTKQREKSLAIVIGGIEQISSMYFEVELILNAEEKRFEQKIRLVNPTSLEHRFYFWTNAAVVDQEDMQLIYPFDWAVNHIEDCYIKWPEYKGVDYRYSKDIPHIYETFGKLLTDDYFAIYYNEEDYGLVHYANREQVKGAKFFSWGKDDLGKAWNTSLTHSDQEYIEIQSGLFETQSVFHFMKPYETIEWSEYWYPVDGLKKMCAAQPEVALGVNETAESMEISVYAPVELKEIQLVIKDARDCQRHTMYIDVGTTKTWCLEKEKYPITRGWESIDIYAGEEILLQHFNRVDVMETSPDIPIFEDVRMYRGDMSLENIKEDKYFDIGRYKESRGEEKEAIELYQKNLEKNPQCFLTMQRLAIIYIKMERYSEAAQLLTTILAYNNVDMQARYYYGVVLARQEKYGLAKQVFYDVSDHGRIKDGALCELMKINLVKRQYRENIKLYRNNNLSANMYANWMVGISYRKLKMSDAQKSWYEERKDENPFRLAEAYLGKNQEDKNNEEVNKLHRGRYQMESIIKAYIDIQHFDEALDLAKVTNTSLLTEVLAYYCRERSQNYSVDPEQNPIKTLAEICKNYSMDYQFFKDHVSSKVLQSYLDSDEKGVIHFLLGNYYYGVNDEDKACWLFEEAYKRGNRYTVLLRNLGYIYLYRNKDISRARHVLYEDMDLNPDVNSQVIEMLMALEIQEGNQTAVKHLLQKIEQVQASSMTIYSKLDGLLALSKYQEAYACIMSNTFYKWEGKEVIGEYYCQIIEHMIEETLVKGQKDKAKAWLKLYNTYPENIEYGDSMEQAIAKQERYRELERKVNAD